MPPKKKTSAKKAAATTKAGKKKAVADSNKTAPKKRSGKGELASDTSSSSSSASSTSSSECEGVVCDVDIDVEGTSLRGSMTAVPRTMFRVFGEDGEKDDDPKTCMEWHFRDSAQNVWAVYDWKNLYYMKREKIFASKEEVVFNIGGQPGADMAEFKAYLEDQIPGVKVYAN